ncbi:myb-like protein AA [Drosophila albomicans]|uniref:Myb-like protein AA n=1 Tax=Drosophila albomicans TaxID=7291 RepID=A0A6P8XN91_DROAB|nr:myb-like protein AA [Drosophila albomicans]
MCASRTVTATATAMATVKSPNWSWLCLCCFVCLAALAQGSDIGGSGGSGSNSGSFSAKSLAMATSATLKDATHMYKIKRQDKYQQQHQKQQLRADVLATPLAGATKQQQQQQQQQPLTRGAHGLNKKMLNKMGFMKVKAPNSHNRKRLAVESRRHASRDDSHMFIIKLPPNLHYYTSPNGVKNALDVAHKPQKQQQQQQQQQEQQQSKQSQQQQHPHQMSNSIHDNNALPMEATKATKATEATEASALKANGKKVLFPFSSNGRPGRIYHWNLPVLKQALHKKPHFAHVSADDRNRLLDIENIPTWRKPWENETVEKSFSAGSGKSKYRKSLKQKSPTYYAPSQAVNKQSFHKYFAGNGKPKGFYVIKEHQTKPQFYQNIIS